jgi:hypothetical protein
VGGSETPTEFEKAVEFWKMIEKSYVGLEVMLRCNEPMELVQRDLGLTRYDAIYTTSAMMVKSAALCTR